MKTTTFRNQSINIPEGKRQVLSQKDNLSLPLGRERLDNVANVVKGSNLLYNEVMNDNNIGFMFDAEPSKKIIAK